MRMTHEAMNYATRVVMALVCLLVLSLNMSAQTAGNYVIGAQDVLAIKVFDQADLDGKYSVESDGTFSFPMIGRIKAAGLTIRQFEEEMKRRLADGYFKNPQVSVAVEQYRSQRIFVMGEVRAPGPVPLTGGMTLIEALARAGSAMPSASGELIIVRARVALPGAAKADPPPDAEIITLNLTQIQTGGLTQQYELRDGDTIYVPRAESVYVFGEVKSPGAYPVQSNTTVLQALSLAGGVTPDAANNRIRIIRMEKGVRKELKNVKMTELVRPGDTIVVPERYF